jgi:hypothetical protein
MKRLFLLLFIATVNVTSVVYGKTPTKFSAGFDIVNAYVWRGVKSSGASFQPSMEVNLGGFYAKAWGTADFTYDYQEIDLIAGYTTGAFSIALTDFWTTGEITYPYFQFDKNRSSHMLEVNWDYRFNCGLSFTWYTMIAGLFDKYQSGDRLKRAYSSYGEAGYTCKINDFQLMPAFGFSPWKANIIYGAHTDGFAVTNISLKAQKELAITDKFSLPVFVQIVFNPSTENSFFVCGLTF